MSQPTPWSSQERGRRMGRSHSGAARWTPVPRSCLFGRPCTCNPAGSLGTCDPHDGRCPCKENVEGRQCDRWVSRSGGRPAGSDLGACGGGRSRPRSSQTEATLPLSTLPGAPWICRLRSYLKVLRHCLSLDPQPLMVHKPCEYTSSFSSSESRKERAGRDRRSSSPGTGNTCGSCRDPPSPHRGGHH